MVAEAKALDSSGNPRFGTPTVVHFCFALLIAAIANAPWQTVSSVATSLGACGVAGVVYAGTIIRHAQVQTHYSPEVADWSWSAVVPLVTHTTLLGGTKALPLHPAAALFVIAGTSPALLFVGIHNAWDAVTYVALTHMSQLKRSKDRGESIN